jgi:enoyl-CoA hydratase/carnithine racemase
MSDVLYETGDGVARITLNRPERGNGITGELIRQLVECVERADLDPDIHVVLLAGNGKGFCGGYDLVEYAEHQVPNHDPSEPWDPMIDHAWMSRAVKGFMSLFHCSKPVVCKVHGFCVAGGTDMALCSDLLVIAADAKIGYPPARVWGSPTTSMWAYRLGAQRAKRLLFTGDSLTGAQALDWGLALEAPAPGELDDCVEELAERIAHVPVNQLQMMKLLVNQSLYSQGLHATQLLGTLFDGIARHTREGYEFQGLALREGFREAVRRRGEPFGDAPARRPGSSDGAPPGSSGADHGR